MRNVSGSGPELRLSCRVPVGDHFEGATALGSRRLSGMVDVIPDRPGSLAGLLHRVGELGANVMDVEHSRISGTLQLGEVDVALDLETRGNEHCAHVTTALHAAGYTVLP